jgi:hypothetical protein
MKFHPYLKNYQFLVPLILLAGGWQTTAYAQSELDKNGDVKIGRQLNLGSFDSRWGVEDDDCVIVADSAKSNSDLILVANDAVAINLDDDDNSNSSFQILNGTNDQILLLDEDGDLSVTGYTKLGSDAPKIRMKKLSGTTGTAGFQCFSHGLDDSKILAVDILVGSPYRYPPAQDGLGIVKYEYSVQESSICILNYQGAQSKPYTILITYEASVKK